MQRILLERSLFFGRKTLRNRINFAKICIWADVNFRTCRDLSPFGNLSCGSIFSVDHFFRRRRPMNITNAVVGNPRFQHLKTVLCTNMFNGSENLRKFHRRKGDKSCSKDHCLLCRKTLHNGIKLRQDLYLSMRKLSNLSRSVAFWQSFPLCFLFSWPLFQA